MRERTRVLAQFEAIRRSGKTNMLDKTTVQRIAYECEYYALVNFIEDADSEKYMTVMQEAPETFDNNRAGLPIDEVPDEVTFETTVTL